MRQLRALKRKIAIKRQLRLGGLGYSASAAGVLLVGVLALVLGDAYPVTSAILLVAVVLALTGLGLRWRKRVKQRKRSSGRRLQI